MKDVVSFRRVYDSVRASIPAALSGGRGVSISEERSEIARGEQNYFAARVLADRPIQADLLGFSAYAAALADFIKGKSAQMPLTVSIDAPSGMGKTSLMRLVEARLQEDLPSAPRLPTIWFNAWRYDKEEPIWAAMALEILTQVRQQLAWRSRVALWLRLNREVLDARLLLLRLLRPLLLLLGIPLLAVIALMAVLQVVDAQVTAQQVRQFIQLAGGLGVVVTLYSTIGKDIYRRVTSPFQGGLTSPFELRLARHVGDPDYQERLGFLTKFQIEFREVAKAVTDNGSRPLVIFVDDLERTTPPKPVEILEAISTWLDTAHCVFVLGMDREVVARSIEANYEILLDESDGGKEWELTFGERFLERTIQLPFIIPRPDSAAFRDFINGLLGFREPPSAVAVAKTEGKIRVRERSFGDWEDLRQLTDAAVPYLGYSPRAVARFINILKLQMLIAARKGLLDDGTIKLEYLARWLVIAKRWPELIEAMRDNQDLHDRLIAAHDIDIELRSLDAATHEQLTRSKLESLLADPQVYRLYRNDELLRLLKEMSGYEVQPYLRLLAVTSSHTL